MAATPKLSAIIITLNEAETIGACLESVGFCDEVIVVDSGSTDDTRAIVEASGATFLHNDWPGFGLQKGHALSLATGEWILSIDADERVTPHLADEIQQAVKNDGAQGYNMPRKSHFLGRWMRHSGWWPDRVLRLAKREKASFSPDLVHERMIVDGVIKPLENALEHYPVRDLGDAYIKVNRYAQAGAEKMIAAGRKPGFAAPFLRGFWSFFSTYVLKRGFLDGREGLINAIIHGDQTYQRYMRAWYMRRVGKSG